MNLAPDQGAASAAEGSDLSALGRDEEALSATEEAAETWRTLAKARPDAFLSDLAMSLNNLGKILGDSGRHEDALHVVREAVQTSSIPSRFGYTASRGIAD